MTIKKFNKFLNWIIPEHVIGFTIYPFGIYYRDEITQVTINHEKFHWEQQKEMFIIFFYLWYGIEYAIKFFKYGFLAYYYISFEREAYLLEGESNYKRRRYNWFKYLIVK